MAQKQDTRKNTRNWFEQFECFTYDAVEYSPDSDFCSAIDAQFPPESSYITEDGFIAFEPVKKKSFDFSFMDEFAPCEIAPYRNNNVLIDQTPLTEIAVSTYEVIVEKRPALAQVCSKQEFVLASQWELVHKVRKEREDPSLPFDSMIEFDHPIPEPISMYLRSVQTVRSGTEVIRPALALPMPYMQDDQFVDPDSGLRDMSQNSRGFPFSNVHSHLNRCYCDFRPYHPIYSTIYNSKLIAPLAHLKTDLDLVSAAIAWDYDIYQKYELFCIAWCRSIPAIIPEPVQSCLYDVKCVGKSRLLLLSSSPSSIPADKETMLARIVFCSRVLDPSIGLSAYSLSKGFYSAPLCMISSLKIYSLNNVDAVKLFVRKKLTEPPD